MKRAFTLIELLVVIAIIAILAAILFPVFAQAKAQAKKAAAISNFKQQTLGYHMYYNDSDDGFPPITYNLSYDANPAHPDAIPQLIIYPYVKNMQIYDDPMDIATDHDRIYTEQVVNPDLVAYKQQQTLFNYLYKSEYGLNWDNLSSLILDQNFNLQVNTLVMTQVANPAKFLFGIDSVWNRNAGGTPYGGGNIALDPPCFYNQDGSFILLDWNNSDAGYYWYGGWNPESPLAWNVFGGAWPWHTGGNICVTAFGDGHAKALQVTSLAAGCNVLPASQGQITNPQQYIWTWQY